MNDFPSPKVCSFIVLRANDPKCSFQFDKIFRFRFLCEDFLMVSNSKNANLSESYFSEWYLEIDTPFQ